MMKKYNLKKIFAFITPIGFIFLMISCASVGQTFNYEKRNSLVLGETTLSTAIQ